MQISATVVFISDQLKRFYNKRSSIVDVKGKHLVEAKQIDDRKKALKLLEEKGNIMTFSLVDKVMEKKGFNPNTISSIDDFKGFDELRHEELDADNLI